MVLLPRFCCIIKKWIPASDSPLHCRKRQITVKLWDLQAQNTTRAEVWRWHYKINQSNNQWTSIINSLLIRFNRENLVTIFKDVRWKWLMIEIRDLNMYLCKFLDSRPIQLVLSLLGHSQYSTLRLIGVFCLIIKHIHSSLNYHWEM